MCAAVSLEKGEAICPGLLRPVTGGPFHTTHSLIDVVTHKSCKKRREETNCELCFRTVLCLMAALREHGILTQPAGGEKVTWRGDGGKAEQWQTEMITADGWMEIIVVAGNNRKSIRRRDSDTQTV